MKVVRCPNVWLQLLACLLMADGVRAAAVEDLPPETRAALTAAACAYPPEKVPALNPADSSRFKPQAALNYLSTHLEGTQYVARVEGASVWTATVHQSANAEAAAEAFKAWSGAGAAVDWPEAGLPVVARRDPASGFAARAQSGPWQLEVMAADEATARSGMNRLMKNARLYALLEGDQLIVEYLPPGGSPQRLQPGQPVRLKMNAPGKTEVAFRISVTDAQGKPIDADGLRVNITLQGDLASFARTERGEQKASIEFTNIGREPVVARWRLPSAADRSFSEALSRTKPGGEDFSIDVEAKYRPRSRIPA